MTDFTKVQQALERRGYTAEIRQLLDPKHLRLFGKDKPEVLVASCMYDNEAINSHVYNRSHMVAFLIGNTKSLH